MSDHAIQRSKVRVVLHDCAREVMMMMYRFRGVRVTGIRDLDGYNDEIRQDRVDALRKNACTFVGDIFEDESSIRIWAGIMGVSPDDLPIVGKLSKFDNLFVNVGHGFRGTNHSMVTAHCLAEVMEGNESELIQTVSPQRFWGV